jgi:hypothetical protein
LQTKSLPEHKERKLRNPCNAPGEDAWRKRNSRERSRM